MSETNNTQVGNVKNLDLVMPCIIEQNVVIIVGKHLESYDNTIEINRLEIMVLLLILIITDPFNSKDKIAGQTDDNDTIIVDKH